MFIYLSGIIQIHYIQTKVEDRYANLRKIKNYRE